MLVCFYVQAPSSFAPWHLYDYLEGLLGEPELVCCPIFSMTSDI